MDKQVKKSKLLLRHSFKGTVLSLSAKEIVQSMIDGLQNQWVHISMATFGSCNLVGKCFGCAATNTVCELIQDSIPCTSIEGSLRKSNYLRVDESFLNTFEIAIDNLRNGSISGYNRNAERIGIATIPEDYNGFLPELTNSTWRKNLHYYQALADSLP